MKGLRRRYRAALGLAALLFWTGCVPKVVTPPPPLAPPESAKPAPVRPHIEGVWENTGRNGQARRMIFEPGGVLRFEGGLEYFNPGQWVVDAERRELKITLPQADDEKVQVFKLYLNDGVKAFNREQKEVTYAFDDQTWSLNVGGWTYSKADNPAPDSGAQPEPVFK